MKANMSLYRLDVAEELREALPQVGLRLLRRGHRGASVIPLGISAFFSQCGLHPLFLFSLCRTCSTLHLRSPLPKSQNSTFNFNFCHSLSVRRRSFVDGFARRVVLSVCRFVCLLYSPPLLLLLLLHLFCRAEMHVS